MDGPKTQFGCHDTRLVLPRTKTDAPLVEKTTQFEGRLGGFETSSGVRWSAIMERAFHDASTHCPGVPTSSAEAAVWVRFEVLNTGRMLLDAIELQRKTQLSFWDSLVVQAAIDSGCEALYTEDLNAGQRIGSVTIVNPFSRK